VSLHPSTEGGSTKVNSPEGTSTEGTSTEGSRWERAALARLVGASRPDQIRIHKHDGAPDREQLYTFSYRLDSPEILESEDPLGDAREAVRLRGEDLRRVAADHYNTVLTVVAARARKTEHEASYTCRLQFSLAPVTTPAVTTTTASSSRSERAGAASAGGSR